MEEDFDVAVIGGGIAGNIAAYCLAQEGHSVILIERGEKCGSKNVSGGIFYCQIMEQIFPNFIQEAPIERIINRNVVTFLNEDSYLSVDYKDQKLSANAVSVLRSKLDKWLASKCEDAGVEVMTDIKVTSLIVEDGRICGVRIGEDELRSKVVVDAEGINAFLPQYAGLRAKTKPHNLAVGVKSVLKLDEQVINERFNTDSEHGVAQAIVGDCTKGVAGGGFMYTNRDSISLGVVLRLDDLAQKEYSSSDLHDYFMAHPLIAPYIMDAELLEYSCHMVAEGGKIMAGRTVFNGMLVIGDAAGLTLNTGFTIRGMDLAAESGRLAAKAISEAICKGDTSFASLIRYEKYVNNSFLGKDMQTYKNAPDFFANPLLYKDMGKFASSIFYGIFNHDLTPRKHLVCNALSAFNKSAISYSDMLKLAVKGVRSL